MEQGANTSAHTVPDTVQAVLLARIDRLPATAKRLHIAAVIGKDVALPLLQAVTDVSEDAMYRDLGHLQAAEFLYETYTPTTLAYTFKHVLTQEVTYQSLVRVCGNSTTGTLPRCWKSSSLRWLRHSPHYWRTITRGGARHTGYSLLAAGWPACG